MKEIKGEAKTIRKLLNGAKYSIDYYQREYKWQSKQLCESGLPFTAHEQFNKADLEARQQLYQSLAEQIWSPARLDRELTI
jgi:hypothetical protein